MNRQVGPSIVLSVLIVCFFAVALFQRDRPRATRDRPRVEPRDAIAGSSPGARPYVDGSSRRVSAPVTVKGLPETTHVASRAVVQASSVAPAGFQRKVERLARAPDESRAEPDGPKPHDLVAVARQPRAAFTVVNAAETIQDVALRVYGSTVQVDSLWRANRDALPRRDSPLSTGMVLRTPDLR
jgi:nucleoid-associated protein YgaU